MRITIAAALLAAACGSSTPAEHPDAKLPPAPDAGPIENLSDYGFFNSDGTPTADVHPYDVNAPLFSDFATKKRYFHLPDGAKITWSDHDRWQFPVGAHLIKEFSYQGKKVETRVLTHEAGGWTANVYLWNDAQTDAMRIIGGAHVNVMYDDGSGTLQALDYRVPNLIQCQGCHGGDLPIDTLGPKTRQLNKNNQIQTWQAAGLFDGALPDSSTWEQFPDPYDTTAPVEPRARAWLEANCAHCHNPDGAAKSTNLYLASDVTDTSHLGYCHLATAAGAGSGGHTFDVVPGDPANSILTFRISSTTPGIKMPEMPIQLVDTRAVQVVSDWIAGLTPAGCP
jgi:uncharacterized repeat protein (TIGR03806 family)